MDSANAPMGKNRLLVPFLCVALFVIVGWTFLPSLNCGFLFMDDQPYVVDNSHVKDGFTQANVEAAFTSIGNSNWHPVTWLSHMLDCQLYGLNPKWHHLTNVLIHACNVLLVFLVLRKLTGATWLSWAAAVLFGIHPLRVQSVTWISERKDVLSLFFWMLTIWAYARFVEETTTKKAKYFYALTFLFLCLGLMSKTMLVTMPFVLLLLDFWPLKRQESLWKRVKEKLPFFIPIIVTSILSYKAQQFGGMTDEMSGLALGYRIENAFVSYARYLGKLFWPVDLCLCYPHPGKWPTLAVMGAVLLVVTISIWAFLLRKRTPYLFVGWFWYLGTLVPVIGLVQLGSQSMADRYTYIPIIGIMVTLVWGAYELTRRWEWQNTIFSIMVATLTIASIGRTRDEIPYWTNNFTVWNRALAVTKNNYIAHYMLGTVFALTPYKDDAVMQFEAAVSLKPDFASGQRYLGGLLEDMKRYPEALEHINRCLAVSPKEVWTWYNGGVTCYHMGRLNDALIYCRKSLELETNALVQDLVVKILQHKTLAKQQNADLRAAMKKEPNRAETINDLAFFLATTLSEEERNGSEAIPLATRACELSYNHPACLNTLAAAYAETGQYDKAIATADQACSQAEKGGDEAYLKSCQAMRELFRAHQPCYEVSAYNQLPAQP